MHSPTWILGFGAFFLSKAKQSSKNHCNISLPCGPAGQCDQGQWELHSLQAAFDFLPSVENAEAGFAQLASFILGRDGIAFGAPGTQISWPFLWSLCGAFEIMLKVSDSSVGILWCRQTWNRIIWLCETAKWCLVIFETVETLENSNPPCKWPPLECLTENVALECYFIKSHGCTATSPWNSHPWKCPGNAKLGTKLGHV